MRRLCAAVALVSLALAPALSGCGEDQTFTPPTLHLGQDVCIACSMIVSDERYASALVFMREDRIEKHVFDDLGEMLDLDIAKLNLGEISQTHWYVKDAGTLQWLDASEAHFMKSDELQTPMGFGVAAYANLEDAQAAAKKHDGRTLTFDQLRAK